jgi:hypothetical protein
MYNISRRRSKKPIPLLTSKSDNFSALPISMNMLKVRTLIRKGPSNSRNTYQLRIFNLNITKEGVNWEVT